jgi:purine-nucleoside phosphorylase
VTRHAPRWYSGEVITWSDRAATAARAVQGAVALIPRVGIILGTGLGGVAGDVRDAFRLSTSTIPNFPRSTVTGHAGELLIGRMVGVPVAVLSGRVHVYEGYEPPVLGLPVRMLHALGVRTLITTNAAGALNPQYSAGDVMLIDDHISFPSLAGHSPLIGPDSEPGLRRFVDLTDAYAPDLRRLAVTVAGDDGIVLRRGTYIMVGGPNFETPAEIRFLRIIGGDAVGMSTVPEVIVARQLHMQVLGLSVMSNVAAGLPGALLDHDDVMASTGRAAPIVGQLIRGILARLPE